MEKHTSAALWRTSALFLIAPPVLLVAMALLKLGSEAGGILGALIYVASAAIWWRWLSADIASHNVSKSSAIAALIVYAIAFVVAIVGYLFYSRGLSRGFTSVSWFVLFCVVLLAAVVAEMALFNAIFSRVSIAF
jgi:hypothetical protein